MQLRSPKARGPKGYVRRISPKVRVPNFDVRLRPPTVRGTKFYVRLRPPKVRALLNIFVEGHQSFLEMCHNPSIPKDCLKETGGLKMPKRN